MNIIQARCEIFSVEQSVEWKYRRVANVLEIRIKKNEYLS